MNLNNVALQVEPDVLALDRLLRQQSQRAEAWLARIDKPALLRQQEEVLLTRFGGTRARVAARSGRKAPKTKHAPTRLTTKQLLEEKLTLQQIADERGLSIGTILSHIEKLKGKGELPDIAHLKSGLRDDDFDAILAAFRQASDGRLAPVHQQFGGKFSFEELRVVRLFAW